MDCIRILVGCKYCAVLRGEYSVSFERKIVTTKLHLYNGLQTRSRHTHPSNQHSISKHFAQQDREDCPGPGPGAGRSGGGFVFALVAHVTGPSLLSRGQSSRRERETRVKEGRKEGREE